MFEEIKQDDKFKLAVGGQEVKIKENWCKDVGNDQYRQRILQTMMLAKNNYEQRRLAFNGSKGDKSKINQLKTEHQNLLNGKLDKQFMPANKNSIEEIEKRKIMKLSS